MSIARPSSISSNVGRFLYMIVMLVITPPQIVRIKVVLLRLRRSNLVSLSYPVPKREAQILPLSLRRAGDFHLSSEQLWCRLCYDSAPLQSPIYSYSVCTPSFGLFDLGYVPLVYDPCHYRSTRSVASAYKLSLLSRRTSSNLASSDQGTFFAC